MSARTSDAKGPGKSRLRSRTLTPASGPWPFTGRPYSSLEAEDLLELHGEHLVARDLELAGEKELHPVGVGILDELLEVLVADRDRAVRRAGALFAGGAA